MKNSHSLKQIQTLHPERRENFQKFVEELESTFTDFDYIAIPQAFRSFEEQDKIYAQGRTTPGEKVTNAKGGQSWHCYGLAIDIVPVKNGKELWNYDYSKFESISKKYGLTWGHHWHDEDHFEDNCGQGPSGWRWALNKHLAKDEANGFINL